MCRLFGFRSVLNSQVHSSLISADNALETQSNRHPDGWGVAYYLLETPHIIKSEKSAINDKIFKQVSGIVSSHTVLAHIRKATLGKVDHLNTHPFQFGPWVFAHNGNVKGFHHKRDELMRLIDPSLQKYVLGQTDSELIFFLILTKLMRRNGLVQNNLTLRELKDCSLEAIKEITQLFGPFSEIDDAGESETYLTFILTNGSMMLAFQGGKNLFYSTHKTLCSERDTCSKYNKSCENELTEGNVNHLILASEPLQGENVWKQLPHNSFVGVNQDMELFFSPGI